MGGRGGTNTKLHLEVGEGREGGFDVKGKGTNEIRTGRLGTEEEGKEQGTPPRPRMSGTSPDRTPLRRRQALPYTGAGVRSREVK